MMCDNRHNFAQPWHNNFYYHYLQQHAAMSYHFQKLHSNIHHYENQFFDMYNPTDVCICNHADCNSLCSSSSSCCSSGSCSKTSSEYDEQEQIDNEEGYDEEQYEDEDYDEDESECEYEFNVDAILAMRAAKEELKKQEQAESKYDESSESKYDESSESKYDESSESKYAESSESKYDESSESKYDESSESEDDESSESEDDESSESKDDESVGSKDERDSKSDNTVLVDSDKDDFEFIDLSNLRIMDCNLYRRVGGFNRCEEVENKKLMMEYLYGSQGNKIVGLESHMSLNFDQECDDNQPSLWPVLPLRL